MSTIKKKYIVDFVNKKLKLSLIKAPFFDEKRFYNVEECLDYISLKLLNWNEHSGLSYDNTGNDGIEYCKNASNIPYILFTSPDKKRTEYIKYYEWLENCQKQEFIIASYSDNFLQVLEQLMPFLPGSETIKFRQLGQNTIKLKLVKNRLTINCNNISTVEVLSQYIKINYTKLVLFLAPHMLWISHFFAKDDRVKVYSIYKTSTFIPLPTKEVTERQIYVNSKIIGDEKYINYGDLPKEYWPIE